jgi:biotin carboxylase
VNNGSGRSVFLLGGGLMQLPAIEAAGELGFIRHLADGNPDCRGRDRVERFHHVDLRDIDGLLATAQRIPGLTGVFTAGTDFSRSVAYVAESLGLPGISYNVAMKATDKGLMREALRAAGVPIPRFVVCEDAHEENDPGFPPPYVVKPIDNMGARGVVRVQNLLNLPKAVEDARCLSSSRRVIVEELIDGTEYSIDALVVDGEVTITGIGERHIFFPPFFVELGHTIPAPLSYEAEAALTDGFTKAIHAIGITNGAAKGDVFLTRTSDGEYGAVIGEIAARLSGGFMSGWTYPLATGVPLTRLALGIATGEPPMPEDFAERLNLVSAERALISAPGTIARIDSAIEHDDRVREVFINNAAGDAVRPPENNVQKVANVIAVAPTGDEAHAAAVEALDQISIVLEPDIPETTRFVCENGWMSRYSQYRVLNETICEALGPAALRDGKTSSWLDDALEDALESGPAGLSPLEVQPIDRFGGGIDEIVVNHVGVSPASLLERLVRDEVVRFDAAAPRTQSVLFWRSFIAAGRQGVRYLRDTIEARRTCTEVTL